MADALVLEAPGARLTVMPDVGGRIGSLVVRGHELLLTEGYGPVMWGCYPMAPWAGRIRNAEFLFRGRAHRLVANDRPHALHGTVFDRPWRVDGPDAVSVDLGDRWPFVGRVAQRFALSTDTLTATMTLEADEPMPAVVGWHPWFRRRLERSGEVELAFAPSRMYRRDAEGIPTGERIAPAPPPWDDCFIELSAPPVLTWPGMLALRIETTLDHWVVYTGQAHALCVEPQSGPPDGPTIAPRVVEPGSPLVASMTWRWWGAGETAPPPPQPGS